MLEDLGDLIKHRKKACIPVMRDWKNSEEKVQTSWE